MKRYLLKSMAALCLTSVVLAAQATEGPTVQVLMEGKPGEFKPMVVNSQGKKTDLTLATFLDAIAETWITGKAVITPKDKLNPDAVAYVRIDRTGDTASAMLYDFKEAQHPNRTDREERATLGVLLGQAAQAAPGCNGTQINGKTVDLKLTFKADDKGRVSTYFIDPKTNKDVEFNLGVMLAYTANQLNDANACK